MKYGLENSVIEAIEKVLSGFPEVEEAIIYGSRAKGNYKNGSDIDITLKGESLNMTVLNSIVNHLDDLLLPYTFDLSIYKQISNSDLIEHISRVGLIFYVKK
ncbi:MAG: nucleotidyltransferase domain-containing protein [Paludibacter sp.]